MITDPVTNRYVEALFSLAKKKGVLDEVSGDVARIGHELDSPTVSAYLFDVRVDLEERRKSLAPLLQTLNELTRDFVELLFDKRREAVLRGLAQSFRRRTMREEGGAEGVVESARPLAPETLERLAESFGSRLGLTVKLESRVVPELVGGVRVTVENRMIDYSVRGRLDGLRRQMLDAPLPTQA